MTKNDFAMKHVIGLIDVIDVELKERRVKSYDLDALHGKRDPQNQNWYKKKKKKIEWDTLGRKSELCSNS